LIDTFLLNAVSKNIGYGAGATVATAFLKDFAMLIITIIVRPHNFFKAAKNNLRLTLFLMILGPVTTLSYMYALNSIGLATTAILTGLYPVFTIILTKLFLKVKIDRKTYYGISLMILGSLILNIGYLNNQDIINYFGLGLALLCALL